MKLFPIILLLALCGCSSWGEYRTASQGPIKPLKCGVECQAWLKK